MNNLESLPKDKTLQIENNVTSLDKNIDKNPVETKIKDFSVVKSVSSEEFRDHYKNFINKKDISLKKINEIRNDIGLLETTEPSSEIISAENKLKEMALKSDIEYSNYEIKEENLEQKEEQKEEQTKSEKNEDKKFKEISEGVLRKLSEVIIKKKELESRVSVLKTSPEFKQLEESRLNLDNNRKILEELKNTDTSANISFGGGNMNFSGNISIGNISSEINIQNKANQENQEVDLEKEAEDLLKKTELEVLKLKKEEIENGVEGIAIKQKEVNIETRQVGIETSIWSSGGMNQKIFNETLKKVMSQEGRGEEAEEEIKNKDLFLELKNINTELRLNKEENSVYYEGIDNMQNEIDGKESEVKDIKIPNESKVLEILGNYNKTETDIKKDTEEASETKETTENIESQLGKENLESIENLENKDSELPLKKSV